MHTVQPPSDNDQMASVTQGVSEAEMDDVQRVFRDLEAEGRNPGHYDVLAIAADLRAIAGDRHLDAASDDAWTMALAWHERAPWPTTSVTEVVR